MAVRAKRRRCFTSIKVWMVSGLRLARRNEIISRPPEKIRSTATAEPDGNKPNQCEFWMVSEFEWMRY